mmetsp:Transcript_10045/g.42262  ORF Transcript_10045/g.42262 Transcript_10045/m.42262 type:complete len:427 (+) Transcript_10045:87-1367(+)
MISEEPPLFSVDRAGSGDKSPKQISSKTHEERLLEEEVFGLGDSGFVVDKDEENNRVKEPKRASVWEDEDDEGLAVDISSHKRLRKLRKTVEDKVLSGAEYEVRLKEFHRRVAGTKGAWASLKPKRVQGQEGTGLSEDESDTEELKRLKQSTQSITTKSAHGPPPKGILDIRRLRNANAEDPCRSIVTTLQFHRDGSVLIVGGLDKTLRIFNIDGETNPRKHGIFLRDLPIHTARFTKGGEEIVVAGERKYFYQFDVHSSAVQKISTLTDGDEKGFRKFTTSSDGQKLAFLGHNGRILLLAAGSKQKIGFVKMNAHVKDAVFSNEDKELLSVGGDGNVYRWDVRTQRCIERHRDEGCVRGTSIGSSTRKGLYACGSDSGVLNLYERGNLTPRKSFLNLTTPLDGIKFSSDGEICAFFSNTLKSAFR